MSVIYYNSMNNDSAERLQKILETEGLGERVERHQTIEGLSNRLCRTNHGQDIAVILVGDISEIYLILSIKQLLHDVRVILILPNTSTEFISAAYKLHPRFISYSDCDFKEVAIVLRRMIKMTEQQSIIEGILYSGLDQKKIFG